MTDKETEYCPMCGRKLGEVKENVGISKMVR